MLFEFGGIFRKIWRGALVLGTLVLGAGALYAAPVSAAAGINQQLNFQGRLLNAAGATAPDGYYNVQFKIYQDGAGSSAGNPGGTLKWTENWLNSAGNGVQVKNGYISVQLGSITPFGSSVDWNQDTLWLSLNIGNTSSCTITTNFTADCAGDGEMLPMKRLSATPYALNAARLGGLAASDFLQNTASLQTGSLWLSGSVRSDTSLLAPLVDTATAAALGIGTTNATSITIGKAGVTTTVQGDLQVANIDTATAVALNIGTTNATAINLNENVTVAADKSLTLTGGTTASRPASPTEGMVWYDTTTKQLLVYSNGKWQADRATSTKIVAASNASQALKDSADYVTDGTDDQTEINAALSAAAGGQVYLSEGTFSTSAAISIPNDTTLSGAGRGTLIQFANLGGASVNMVTNSDTSTGEGIVIRNLRLDGNSSVNSSGTVQGIYLNGVGSAASLRQGPIVTNIWVVNFRTNGIRFDTSSNGSITEANFQSNGTGIYLSSGNRLSISNNTFLSNTNGITLAGSLFNTVSANNFISNSSIALQLSGGSHDNTITGNTLRDNTGSSSNSSILVSGSSTNNLITSNEISDTAGSGYAINISDAGSTANYLADNYFNGTGATSINDASPNTVYANQSRAASGGQLTNRSASSTESFVVQNASGSNLFAVDSTNSQVVVGNSSAAGKLVLSDGSGNTATITVAALAGNYTYTVPTTTADDTFCLVTLGNCAADSTQFIQNQNTAAQTSANFWISGSGRADNGIIAPSIERGTAGTLSIGTNAAYSTALTIGNATTTTTINGNLGVTLNTTAGTTITCRNGSGYLSVCDSSVLTPSAANFIQNGTTVQTSANFWIDGVGKVGGGLQSGSLDSITAGGNINIGTSNAGSLSIGKSGITTTIQGNIGVTLNATTGTTIVCRNATGLLSACDATYLAPTTTNFIQNQAGTPGTAQTGNFNITGTGIAGVLQAADVVTEDIDTATAAALNIGSVNATAINLNQDVVVAADKDLTFSAGTGAFDQSASSGTFKTGTGAVSLNGDTTVGADKSLTLVGGATRPGTPSEGMLWYDTTTKQLVRWNGTKWISDSTEAIIVAASNSSQAEKDAADYVADGNTAAASDGDQVEINQALSAGTGKKVILLAGTYTIDAAISVPNNTTLAGAGAGSVITIPNSFNAGINAITNTTSGGNGTGITIQDLKLEGNRSAQASSTMNGIYLTGVGSASPIKSGAKINNVWIKEWRTNSVQVDTSYNTTITGSDIGASSNAGIYVSSSANTTISANTVQDSVYGLYLSSSSASTITGNTIQANSTGVYGTASTSNTLSANTVQGNGSYGIAFYSSSNNNTINGNTVQNNSYTGISLDNSSYNTVNSNTLKSNNNIGIFLSASSHNTVNDNAVQQSTSSNIYLYSGSNNNIVSGNRLHDSDGAADNNGIYIYGSNSNTLTSNTITDSSATGTNYAININNTSNTNYLADNSIGSASINNLGTGTVYGGQVNAVGNFVIQPAGTVELMKDTNVTGTLSATDLVAGSLERGSAGTLTIGTNATTTTAITVGSAGITTTIAGDTGVTLNATTGTTMVCRNASGVLSSCDAGYLAPTTTNFIQNGTTQQASSNFNISGTGIATTLQATTLNGTTLDTATAVALEIGTVNATVINLNENVTVAAGKTLTMNGGTTGSRPASPTDGMLWYDTDTKELVRYNGTKWVSDGSNVYLVAASNSSQADKDAADYVATGTGDQTTIQSALDRADPASAVSGARKSGKVYLFAGTYTITASIQVRNNTTLAGAGAGTIITIPNSHNTAINALTNYTTGGNGTGIIIQDLKLDGNKANNTTGNMYGLYLNGVGSTGTTSTSVLGAKISNIWSNNWRNGGIYLGSTASSTITNVTAQGSSSMGILVSGSSNNIFSNNTLVANGHGFYLNASAANNTFTGNYIAGNGTTGIDLEANTTANTISNNKFIDNGNNDNNAIYLVTSTNNIITGNVISDSTATNSNYAINITNAGSTGNTISNNSIGSTATINDAASTSTIYAGQFTSNTNYSLQPAVGITVGNSSTTTTIQGNTSVTLSATTATGMVCRNTSNGILSTCDASYLAPTATNFIQNTTTQQTGNFNITGNGTAGTLQATTSLATPSIDAIAGTLSLGTGANTTSVTIGKAAASTLLASNTVTIGTSGSSTSILGATQTTTNTTGDAMTIRGSTGNGTGAGGSVTIQGGNAGATSGANGGNLVLSGGTGTGTGVNGLVVINNATYTTASVQTSATSVNVTQANIDAFGAIILSASASNVNFTLTSPALGANAAGRVIYVTAANGSQDFTLRANVGGGIGVEQNIAMRQNTTATMIWNGSQWTAAGASSSTTLQAAYDNTLQSAGGAELVVGKSSATNGLTIRDSVGATAVNGALLTVQSGSAANLFSVNSNVTEYTSNSGAETYSGSTTAFPASTWTALSGSTVTRQDVAGDYIATGQGSVKVVTTAVANTGVKNQLVNSAGAAAALNANTTYNVSFTTRLLSGTFTDMNIYYSADGSAASVLCATSATAATSVWTKVNCTFTTPASSITSGNAILIRQTAGTARTFYVDNLSVTIAADYNFATDGGVGDAANFSTNWTTAGLGTVSVSHQTGDGYDASNSAQATVTAGAANAGMRNKLSSNPLPSTLYRITVYAKSSNTFNDFKIRYSRNGGTNYVDCVDYNTQSISTTEWTKVTCYVTTDSTAATNPYVYFVETASATRTFYVDAFSMTLRTSTTPNVQIGGGVNGGPTTLLTLDKGASAPIASDNDALLGSMYYDTTLGKLQCYEADGWGACGSSPDTVVTISPEFNNAVMHGTGIGTMTSDICSDTLNINDSGTGTTICGTNETYNFYKWTSPQASAQTYSIYVTYQLPSTFKEFASGQTSVMGRTDSANSSVTYQIFRSDSSGLAACSAAVTVSSGVQTTWQTKIATGGADPSTCSFEPGNSIVFKIDMTASGTSNSYVSNLNFIFSNR